MRGGFREQPNDGREVMGHKADARQIGKIMPGRSRLEGAEAEHFAAHHLRFERTGAGSHGRGAFVVEVRECPVAPREHLA
jgi:hypothetical protein